MSNRSPGLPGPLFLGTAFFLGVLGCTTDTAVFSAVDGGLATDDSGLPDGFCEAGGVEWAFCDDFDGLGSVAVEPFAMDRGLSWSSHQFGDRTRYRPDCASTSSDTSVPEEQRACAPYFLRGELVQNAEDSGYAFSSMRVERPLDFAGREGRIHFNADLDALAGRKRAALFITPHLTNTVPDIRGNTGSEGSYSAEPGLVILFSSVDGLMPFSAQYWSGGEGITLYGGFGPLSSSGLSSVDVFLTRTSVRILVDGAQEVDETIPDLGFDRAYVYFTNLALESRKDGAEGAKEHRLRWDNIAFDGPMLGANALVSMGEATVLFSAWGKRDCTVLGMPAQGSVVPNYLWQSWHLQIDAGGVLPSAADVICTDLPNQPSGGTEDFRVISAP